MSDRHADISQRSEVSRFEILRMLGKGGIACVYEAFDRTQQRRVALKRLQVVEDAQRRHRLVELIEREFYTLSQLSHPAIVQAYDYGVDEDGPYYTMELLEGGELHALAPLPYKRACAIASELCSALSLLHSRRLVYRDLNPRNVRCDVHGAPKLIDFGAIAPMGPCAHIVGTPAYCAPEVLDLQPLDGRIDLFSLGATLYFMLTGEHAFPARTFAQLGPLWDQPPTRLSTCVADLPPRLEDLVLEMLRFDPASRPANAGELMEELAAISGLARDEHAAVAQAYLSTPSMVGRGSELALVRGRVDEALRGRGSSVLVSSASGAGRSRFLAACQLDAKMSGALVAHAAAGEVSGDYAVVRALGEGLLELVPELARGAAEGVREVLERILPGLVGLSRDPVGEGVGQIPRPQVLAAVGAWVAAIARERPLVLVIDDYHRSDEPSAACFSWLAHAGSQHALVLVASTDSEAKQRAADALKVYESSASRVSLGNLSEVQTTELLRSVFGNVPNVQSLGHALYAIASGNPRDTLRLAQTLVDRGIAKYSSGSWSLPVSIGSDLLPQSMRQAVMRELEALDPVALRLVRGLSLIEDRALDFDECRTVCRGAPTKLVHNALQQLVRRQFARLEAEGYLLAHRGLHAAARSGGEPQELEDIHLCIAEVFARRTDEPLRHAKHLLLSGEEVRGVDALVEFAVTSQARTDADPTEYVNVVQSLPDDWLQVFDRAITICKQQERPSIDTFRLRNRLASFLNIMGAVSHIHLLALIRQLCRESGLDAYAALDARLDARERLKQALAEAKRQHEAASDQTRGLEPGLAMRYLVRALLLAAGMVAVGLDYSLSRALPSIAPLEPLSPAFGLIERLLGAVALRVGGSHERARTSYAQILERLDQPDLAGLDPSNHRFLRYGVMYGIALIEAGMGLRSSLAWAKTLEAEPLHAVNALQVRIVHELWQGRAQEANDTRELAELRRIESGTRQMADGSHLVWQMLAHAYSDDLTGLKQLLDELRALERRHPAWAPVVNYALAECQRMRGDDVLALDYANTALRQLAAGHHQIWPHVVASQIAALCAQGFVDAAIQVGEGHLQEAESADLGYLANYIRMPLSIACSRSGKHDRALELVEEALSIFDSLGTAGMNQALVYEAYSIVAGNAGRSDESLRFARLCVGVCRSMSSRGLRSRAERLLRSATPEAPSTREPAGAPTSDAAIRSALLACETPRLRAERALQLLLSSSGAEAGSLYAVTDLGPVLVAQVGQAPSPDLITYVTDLVEAEVSHRGLMTASIDTQAGTEPLPTVSTTHSLVLLCHQTPLGVEVTAVAALAIPPAGAFVHPGSLAARLSNILAELGDLTSR